MDVYYYILFFIIGTFMGSFYTVVGLRLPKKEPFVFSRSKCDECKHQLSFIEMIPVISFIFLKGRCRHCNSKIDSLSTFIELFTGLLFTVAFYSFGFSWSLILAIGIISLLVIVIVSDLTYLIIPDGLLVFFSIYFIVCQYFIIGIFLFLIMYGIMSLGNKIFKKESMGGGDVKMMFLFGIVLDPLLGTLTIFLGSLIALPMSLILYFKEEENVIPFGPFLLISFALMFFTKLTPEMIIKWLGF